MRKYIILAATLVAGVAALQAQSAIDLYNLSGSQLRGTARYMSMAGAFGALGGDISVLNQNPAGIGVYRSSDIAATLDIDAQRTTMMGTGASDLTNKQTRTSCNNLGYVGAIRLGSSVMPYFQWGATYSRVHSFERFYSGYFPTINTSWSNYVADFSNGYSEAELQNYSKGADWLSVLAYNSWIVNPNTDKNDFIQDVLDNPNLTPEQKEEQIADIEANEPNYKGLYTKGISSGDAYTEVNEQGYIDEYSLNFGGNISDILYWGVGLGIRDLSYTRFAYYNEHINDAWVPVGEDEEYTYFGYGTAKWGINSYQHISGSGFNLKIGLMLKPINELRFGVAVHTPTWYNLETQQSADINFGLGQLEADGYYTFDNSPGGPDEGNQYTTTPDDYLERSIKTPWRVMASAAGVIGGRFIISADYVHEVYTDMGITGEAGNPEVEDIANDVKQYFKNTNELRIGAEMRVTPAFSIRAGYGFKTSSSQSEAYNNNQYVYTSGVSTMYTFDGDRQNITLGLGYRFGNFSIDAAYVHTTQTSQWSAFSPFPRNYDNAYALVQDVQRGPTAQLKDTRNRFALTLGFRF